MVSALRIVPHFPDTVVGRHHEGLPWSPAVPRTPLLLVIPVYHERGMSTTRIIRVYAKFTNHTAAEYNLIFKLSQPHNSDFVI